MNNTFTDEQIIELTDYDFNRNQINRLEALPLNLDLDLDLDNIYDNIRHIINAYPPQEPDLDIRISNETLICLLEQGYSFEDIESLLEYELIDEDFEWIIDHPEFIYSDIYHALGDGFSFNEIKDQLENMPDDEPEVGGKRRRKSRKQSKTRRKKQGKTRRKKQGKR
jgi:hypothetical protein